MTYFGGSANSCVVYKVNPSGQDTVLHTCTGGAGGSNPLRGALRDAGGKMNTVVVFKIKP